MACNHAVCVRRSKGWRQLLPGATAQFGVFCFSLAVTAGCANSEAQPTPIPPTIVTVSRPVLRDVVDDEEFTGRTAAVETVDVRARVSGFLQKVDFVAGSDVVAGQTLFEIDVRPFKAALRQAQAQFDSAQAQLKKAAADMSRADTLLARKVISQQDYDQTSAASAQAQASVEAAEAAIDKAKLDVEFCTLKAPIAGQIGRPLVTQGNLVNADSTQLTTIAAVEPIYIYFNVDERTLLRLESLVRDGKLKAAQPGEIPVFAGLANEKGYPHEGTMDFQNNTVDSSTGTIQVRAVFKNPKPAVGARELFPGLFARVRVPIGSPHPALLITDRAIATSQGQKYVYVVDAEKKVFDRPVQVGRLVDGLRVIEEGLKPDERIIVNGLQRVRPGITVDPQEAKQAAP
jgi:RND family efflux transporter MFP subunit